MVLLDFILEKELLRGYHAWYICGKAEISPYQLRRFFNDEESVQLGTINKLLTLCDQIRSNPDNFKRGKK